MELAILFVWLICGIVAGFIASARGASSCAGTIFGFLFGPLGILIACFLPSSKPTPVVIQQGTATVEPGAAHPQGDGRGDGITARSVLARPIRCKGSASTPLGSLARAGRIRELSLTAERPLAVDPLRGWGSAEHEEPWNMRRMIVRLAVVGLVLAVAACSSPQSLGSGSLPDTRGSRAIEDNAKGATLLYVSDANDNLVYMIALPSGKLVGKLSGFDQPTGLCSDSKGNVYVVDSQAHEIVGYQHAAKSAFEALSDGQYIPVGCSVDPITGDLAVANCCGNLRDGSLAIYSKAKGSAKYYADSSMYVYWFCAYDGFGNLYVSGINQGYTYQLDVMPGGKHRLSQVTLNPGITGDVSPSLQWDGDYLAIASPDTGAIFQYAVNGTQATQVHVTKLAQASGVGGFWIAGSGRSRTLYAPIDYNSVPSIRVYAYPKGGKPLATFYDVIDPFAATVSVPAQ